MGKRILIITTGWFPEGEAGSVRLMMVGKALVAGGYDVTVLCRGKLNDSGTVAGIRYVSLRNLVGNKLIAGFDYLRFPTKIKKYLNKNREPLYGIYIYNAHIEVFEYCKRFCKKHGIKLFHDCVEWYSPENYKGGEKSKAYKTKNRINTEVIDDSFKIIAISKYLENYFASKKIETLRLPILCDCTERTTSKKENGKMLTLFYGGFPGRKDNIGNILDAALLLSEEERRKLRIVWVGPTKRALVEKAEFPEKTIDQCAAFLDIKGKMPRAQLLQLMEEADFALLVRDASLRYAKAGFPSKVVEALANATPMLCNLSSDLDEYLVDGYNAILAKDHTPEALAEAMRRALNLTANEKNIMSRNALETAKDRFDYRAYVEELGSFLG